MAAGLRNITYDITDLYAFIDNLGDLSCLVFNPQLQVRYARAPKRRQRLDKTPEP